MSRTTCALLGTVAALALGPSVAQASTCGMFLAKPEVANVDAQSCASVRRLQASLSKATDCEDIEDLRRRHVEIELGAREARVCESVPGSRPGPTPTPPTAMPGRRGSSATTSTRWLRPSSRRTTWRAGRPC